MKLRILEIGLFCGFLSLTGDVLGQRQLVMVNNRGLVARYNRGDRFVCKTTLRKEEHWGYILAINEFNIITTRDTIPLSKIQKIKLPGRPALHKIGATLVTVGALYLAIDLVNAGLVQKTNPLLDRKVARNAAIISGTGAPLLLFKKKWAKMDRGVKIKSVGRESNLYKPML